MVEKTKWKAWTDSETQALCALRAAGVTYRAISEILGRSQRSCEQQASKLNLTYGAGGSRVGDGEEFVSKDLDAYKSVSSLGKGKIAEDLVTIELTKRGFDVFVPYKPQHHTDIIVIDGSKACKIQVKSAIWDQGTGRFRVPLHRKDARNGKRFQYIEGDIDFFILYCLGIDASYVVPFNLCNDHAYANLYPHRPKLQQKGFNWENYKESYQLIDAFLTSSN